MHSLERSRRKGTMKRALLDRERETIQRTTEIPTYRLIPPIMPRIIIVGNKNAIKRTRAFIISDLCARYDSGRLLLRPVEFR